MIVRDHYGLLGGEMDIADHGPFVQTFNVHHSFAQMNGVRGHSCCCAAERTCWGCVIVWPNAEELMCSFSFRF